MLRPYHYAIYRLTTYVGLHKQVVSVLTVKVQVRVGLGARTRRDSNFKKGWGIGRKRATRIVSKV